MRVAVSILMGGVAFGLMAFALIVVKESIENPIILVAATMAGLATFSGAYIADRLTSQSE